MKRIQPVESEVPQLPSDLIIEEIVRLDEWECAGAVARCSKHLLREMCRPAVLAAIMATVKRKHRRLFRWLLFALPYAFTGQCNDAQPFVDQAVLTMRRRLARFRVADTGWFVYGAFVCDVVYDRRVARSRSDIDVLTRCGDNGRASDACYVSTDHMDYPAVLHITQTQAQHIERVIECFELSVEQQGVFSDGAYYTTALALYSRQCNEIVVVPTTVDKTQHFIDTHFVCHAYDTLFHDCVMCLENSPIARRFRQRLSRFPGVGVVYCEPPSCAEIK